MLYVGKARDLKKRVSSYFQKSHGGRRAHRPHGRADRAHGDDGGALGGRGAAAREQPHQDARAALQHPVSRRQELSVPEDHRRPRRPRRPRRRRRADFPRVAYYRGAVDRAHRYFGPFPSAWAVKESIQLLQKVFHLRTCEDTVFANRTRPCLLYQIKRCSGPCVGLIAPADYARDVANAERFLDGEQQELMDALQARDDGARRGAGIRAGGRDPQPARRAVARAAPAVGRGQHRRGDEGRRHPRGQGRGRPGLRQPGDGARRPPPRRPALLPDACRGRDRRRCRGGRDDVGSRRRADASVERGRPKSGCSRPSSRSTTSKAACRRCWC